jgi:hypothetical protein
MFSLSLGGPPKAEVKENEQSIHPFEFMSEGILSLLQQDFEKNKELLKLSDDQVYKKLDVECEQLYGLKVYTSKIRKAIIDFCGWSSEFVQPRYKEVQN